MVANMGKFLLFLSLFISNVAFCQLNDSFTDGNLTQNPTWLGDVTGYTINTNRQLQTTTSAVSQTVSLYTANSLGTNAKWEFYIQLGFDPSTGNQSRIYLVSNQADLNGPLNGYFLQIGESGNTDSYDLFRQDGTTTTRIIDGPPKTRVATDELKARVQITRNISGLWEVKTDIAGGTNYTSEGTITDNTYTSSNFFGVRSIYTLTRSSLFIYDDFLIEELVPDVTPPVLNTAITTNGTNIILNFNEAVNATDAAIASHYSITPGNITPATVTVTGSVVTLNLATQLITGNYNVAVSMIKDIKGNTAGPQSKGFFYRKPYTAQLNDIVINEIFADPSPQIDLPSVEFVEIWNRSTEDISLAGFKYSDPSSTATFGTLDSIKANQFIILCARADTAEFKKYGKVFGLSPWPTLNNSNDLITLVNQNNTIISQANYSDVWYKDAVKKNGGWTLELIDPLSTCKPSQNYAASVDALGGTPGKQNSIYLSNRSTAPLQLIGASLKDSLTISLTFNRGLDSLNAALTSRYSVNNGVGVPQAANLIAPSFATVEIKFATALARNQNYTVTVNGITDCGTSAITNQSLSFVYPGLTLRGDVLINEILFNPRTGGVDFVEVYNFSDKILDLKDLKLATIFATKDSVISVRTVSTSTILFQPKSYWVLTTQPDTVKSQYETLNPNNFVKMSSFPSFNDDNGKAVILNKDDARLDQIDYDKSLHFALIRDLNGVSLERSSFTQPTNAKGNFRSAAANVGYATPSYKNSQFLEESAAVEEITIPNQTFSPDNDGFEDVLPILFKFSQPNYAANVTIYNDQGVLIKKLVRNETIGSQGQWIWDGLTDTNQKARTGIYIVYAELFDLNGNVKKYKKTAVLAGQFN
jgi:flagellar hook assembly protein FlgD